jgi:2-isopropylmalate synthase
MAKRFGEWVYDWNSPNGREEPAPGRRAVELDDETLRDGLQSPSAKSPPLQAKRDFLHILAKLGVQAVDIGIPASSPTAFHDAIYLAKEIGKAGLPLSANCASRTVVKDVRQVIEVSQRGGIPVEVAVFIGSSAIRHHAEDWDESFVLKSIRESVAEGRRAGLKVMIVTEDTTRARPDLIRKLYSCALGEGAQRACIADTVGFATPEGARRLVTFLRGVIQDAGVEAGVDWHGHQDRGLSLAAALGALEGGADRIHGSALGLGERVGNTPLDLVLVNLKMMGLWEGDLESLPKYLDWVERYAGVAVPWNYPVFGRDAFRTGTGIHAAAIMKALEKGDQELVDLVYSAVPAWWIGKQQTIEVGPMSGDSNVIFWLRKQGVDPTPETIRAVRDLAKESDHTLTDDEIWDVLHRMEKP